MCVNPIENAQERIGVGEAVYLVAGRARMGQRLPTRSAQSRALKPRRAQRSKPHNRPLSGRTGRRRRYHLQVLEAQTVGLRAPLAPVKTLARFDSPTLNDPYRGAKAK